MADPITAMATVAGVSVVGKAFFQSEAADSNNYGLNLRAEQEALAYQEKTLKNYDITQKILDRQTAQMTTRGVGFGSPSFNAIQRDTLNTSAKELKNEEIEHNIFQENIDIEKRNVKDTLFAQLFGDITEGAMSFASLSSKTARKGP